MFGLSSRQRLSWDIPSNLDAKFADTAPGRAKSWESIVRKSNSIDKMGLVDV
jgi:hypothetical protein